MKLFLENENPSALNIHHFTENDGDFNQIRYYLFYQINTHLLENNFLLILKVFSLIHVL